MSRIRSRSTKPELILRRALHASGVRFRIHRKDLPGCPDLVFPRYQAIIMVHGCFWHGHGCLRFKLPTTRPDFWSTKIVKNKERAEQVLEQLAAMGSRTLIVWECALMGPSRYEIADIILKCERFLSSRIPAGDIGNDSCQRETSATVEVGF